VIRYSSDLFLNVLLGSQRAIVLTTERRVNLQ
jgi:hypothetical protein